METILAITIIVLIMGTVYAFYNYSVQLTIRGREKLQECQLARAVLHKVALELKAVASGGGDFTTVLRGDPDNISFITTVIPSRLIFFPQEFTDNSRIIEHDLRKLDYSISRTQDHEQEILGIQRVELRCLLTTVIEDNSTDNLTAEEIQEASEELKQFDVNLDMGSNAALSQQPILQQSLLSDRIKFLRFDYFDGTNWLNTWHPSQADIIPRAVQVTIGFKEMSNDEFQQEQLLAMDQRPWHDDQYSIVVPLILSNDLKSQYSGSLDNQTQEANP